MAAPTAEVSVMLPPEGWLTRPRGGWDFGLCESTACGEREAGNGVKAGK